MKRFNLLAVLFVIVFSRLNAFAFDNDSVVVLVSVDGLAGFYLDDLKAEMPNIRSLAREGARASSMLAVTPTVTWPNHTSLVTGATPAVHGVVGNNYFDRKTLERVTLIQDPVFDKEQIVKVPTIYDAAKSNGLRTAAIRWPASRNAKNLDFQMPENRTLEQTWKFTTPALAAEWKDVGLSLADKKHETTGYYDEKYTQLFDLVLKKHRPQLALLHLSNVDHTEHEFGPRSPEAYKAIQAADAEVGEIWRELETDFPGKATLFVVSDHGFSYIKKMIYVNNVLKKAGLWSPKDNGKKSPVAVVSQGGSVLIYILDEVNRDALQEKIAGLFGKIKGVSKIVRTAQLKDYGVADPKDDPHAPDMILHAAEGYTFGDTAAGDLTYNEKPERHGSHGHEAALPNLHATFVACGAGIKPGTTIGEIKNLDVAPTIAKLMNLSLPTAQGKSLDEILLKQ